MSLTDKIRQFAFTGILGVYVLASPGCVSPKNEGYDNSSMYLKDQSIEDMLHSAVRVQYEAAYANEEDIKTLMGVGTGFIVGEKDKKQYFMTCYHVIDSPDKITSLLDQKEYSLVYSKASILVNGKQYEMDVVKTNPEADIAVLKTRELTGLEQKLDFVKKPIKQGDMIYAVGYPLDIGKFISNGIITHVGPESFFFEDAVINPGNSGGPLFVLENGKPYIAGMGRFYIRNTQGMFGAVKPEYLKQTLDEALQ